MTIELLRENMGEKTPLLGSFMSIYSSWIRNDMELTLFDIRTDN